MGREQTKYEKLEEKNLDTMTQGASILHILMNYTWIAYTVCSVAWLVIKIVLGEFTTFDIIWGTVVPVVVLKVANVLFDNLVYYKGKIVRSVGFLVIMNLYIAVMLIHPSGLMGYDCLYFGIMAVFPLFSKTYLVKIQTIIAVAVVVVRHIVIAVSGSEMTHYNYILNVVLILFSGLVVFMAVKFVHNQTLILGDTVNIDSLTGLYNHESFYEELEKRMYDYDNAEDFEIDEKTFSIMIADIDNFKKVNDTYGHAYGDKVISAISEIFIDFAGNDDFAARYGGEEFALIMGNTNKGDAITRANNIRKKFASTIITTADGEEHQFTCSIGVAQYRGGNMNSSEFFDTADKALYEAKRTGKNRVNTAVETRE